MLFSTVYDDIASYFRNVFDARIQHASYVLLALVELVAQHIRLIFDFRVTSCGLI